jgi:hypothetical protein
MSELAGDRSVGRLEQVSGDTRTRTDHSSQGSEIETYGIH